MSQSAFERVRMRAHLDKKNGWIAGVCAGLANMTGWDVAVIRVAAVIAGMFVPKVVIAVYLIAWLVLDER